MCNAVYIIAYKRSRQNVETRQKRSDNHSKQVEWWLNYDKQIEIRILAMDFDESEFWNDPVFTILTGLTLLLLLQVQETYYLITSMTQR